MYPESFQFSNGSARIIGFYRNQSADQLNIQFKFAHQGSSDEKEVIADFSVVRRKERLFSIIPYGINCDESAKMYNEFKAYIFSALESSQEGIRIPYGYTDINDHTMYNLGGVIINKPEVYAVLADNPQEYKLDLIPCSLVDMKQFVVDYIHQGHNTATLLLCCLSSFANPTLKCMDLRPANAYCHGDSGLGKTEEAKIVVDIFSNKSSGHSLASDISVLLQARAECKDFPFFLDDLNKTPSASQRDKREEKLCTIIHISSSGGEISTKGTRISSSSCGLVTTAEYTMSNPSTNNRNVLIRYDSEFDSQTLRSLKNRKPVYIYFLYSFIEWICKNKNRLESFRSIYTFSAPDIKEVITAIGRKRIESSYHTLHVTKELLLMFMKERNIISDAEKVKLLHWFNDSIDKAITDTAIECQPKLMNEEDAKIISIILDTICDPESKYVVGSHHKYEEKNKFVFLRRKKFFSFRGRRMLAFLEMHNIFITPKQLTKVLKSVNLIRYQGLEPTYRLPDKYKDNHRYYHIPKTAIEQISELESNSIFKVIGSILDSKEQKGF